MDGLGKLIVIFAVFGLVAGSAVVVNQDITLALIQQYDFSIYQDDSDFIVWNSTAEIYRNTSIQSAYDYGKNLFPTSRIGLIGNFQVNEVLNIQSNSSIELTGIYSCQNGYSGNLFNLVDQQNISISNGVIDGNKANADSNYLIFNLNSSNTYLSSIEIRNSKARAIQIQGKNSVNVTVYNCNINNNVGAGVATDGTLTNDNFPSYIYVNSNSFSNNYQTSIAFYADDSTTHQTFGYAVNNTIQGSNLLGSSENGITLCAYCYAYNNKISSVEDNGIELRSAYFSEAKNNQITLSGFNGLIIYNTNHSIVENNQISDSGQWQWGQNSGLRIFGFSKNNTVNRNTVTDFQLTPTQQEGIFETENADYNIISNCIAIGNIQSDISINGTNTIVTNSYTSNGVYV